MQNDKEEILSNICTCSRQAYPKRDLCILIFYYFIDDGMCSIEKFGCMNNWIQTPLHSYTM